MLEQTARKGSLFLLSDCVILESEFLAKPAVIKNTAVFLFLNKKALTNCEGSEGKTWKKGFCFLVEVIGE